MQISRILKKVTEAFNRVNRWRTTLLQNHYWSLNPTAEYLSAMPTFTNILAVSQCSRFSHRARVRADSPARKRIRYIRVIIVKETPTGWCRTLARSGRLLNRPHGVYFAIAIGMLLHSTITQLLTNNNFKKPHLPRVIGLHLIAFTLAH